MDAGVDALVDADAVLRRFLDSTRTLYKEHTREQYAMLFRVFAREMKLEQYTRKQLAGGKGKVLIKAYIEQHPRPSWRTMLGRLKGVWTAGLGLPWPINIKAEFGKLPRGRREETPPDGPVKQWAEALRHETDLYLRLTWLFLAQHGWRPSHIAKVKWRNIRYQDGRPWALVADGVQEDFKTPAPVAVKLAPDVVEALENWRKTAPSTIPEKPILPWRSKKGIYNIDRIQITPQFRRVWASLRRRWNLPALRPKDLRHWVATTCRKSGLSKQASAYLMGHDSASGGQMRDWYDNPQLVDIFDEQGARLPGGPLGFLYPPEVRIIEGLPEEVLKVVQAYMRGEISTMTMANDLENARMKRAQTLQVLQP